MTKADLGCACSCFHEYSPKIEKRQTAQGNGGDAFSAEDHFNGTSCNPLDACLRCDLIQSGKATSHSRIQLLEFHASGSSRWKTSLRNRVFVDADKTPWGIHRDARIKAVISQTKSVRSYGAKLPFLEVRVTNSTLQAIHPTVHSGARDRTIFSIDSAVGSASSAWRAARFILQCHRAQPLMQRSTLV